uniref:G-patch domain-containing protein n=1 Tax=Parastrongyloides trichosuri TaxID=131310 RepID=A0A0N4Z6F9_PARTI
MSILAAQKRKQKIPLDPNNLIWQNSEKSVAKKLLKKMGWAEGKGLGKEEQGDVDGIKVKSNTTQKGLGCEGNYEKTWVGHHDDFASILANLNKNKKVKVQDEKESSDEDDNNKVLNLEERARGSKRRIHYQKFIKRKDLSQATDADKLQIFGKHSVKKCKKEKIPEKKVKKEDKKIVDEEKTETVSTMSMEDYFKAKMEALKNKKE